MSFEGLLPGSVHDQALRKLVAPSDWVNPEPQAKYDLVGNGRLLGFGEHLPGFPEDDLGLDEVAADAPIRIGQVGIARLPAQLLQGVYPGVLFDGLLAVDEELVLRDLTLWGEPIGLELVHPLRKWFIDQFLLVLVELRFAQQADRLQMLFDDVAELRDDRRHELATGLPVAAIVARVSGADRSYVAVRTIPVAGEKSTGLGLAWLAFAVNLTTCALGAACLLMYLFLYTPLKRLTWTNTLVGAIPGALPPLMGWTAASGRVSLGGLALFAILACWQLPHFMAIAWIYRDEYGKAGFQMLPVLDPKGLRTSRHALAYTVALVIASISIFALGLAGPFYIVFAAMLGLGFLIVAVRFTRELTVPRARQLFYASILYLPFLLIAMVLNKAGQ